MAQYSENGSNQLNVGCGRGSLPGWINLDSVSLPGVDLVFDLEECGSKRLPLPDDSVETFLLSHVLEHIRNVLPLMQELHRVAKPGAIAWVRVPHGGSDDAFEDPTHLRQYFPGSFGYYGQPYYWRADYGYRGDWLARKLTLRVRRAAYPDHSDQEILALAQTQRNVVSEMVCELVAIKPIREPLAELRSVPETVVEWV